MTFKTSPGGRTERFSCLFIIVLAYWKRGLANIKAMSGVAKGAYSQAPKTEVKGISSESTREYPPTLTHTSGS